MNTTSEHGNASDKRLLWALVSLAILGFALRLGTIVALQSWERPNAIEHRAIAHSILAGDGFSFRDMEYYGPSSIQSPTYPLLLTGLFYVFGPDHPAAYFAALLINAALGSLTVWLTYLLARTLGAGVGLGLIAAALCAVWPSQIYATSHAQAITFITAAAIAMMVLFYRSVRSSTVRPWIALSVIAAVAALTEPVFLPTLGILGVLILVWPGRPLRARLGYAALLCVAALVVIGPWTIRNRTVHGRWVPVKSLFWTNVWKGNNDHATGTDRLALSDEQRANLSAAPVEEFDKMVRQESLEGARQYDMLTKEQKAELWNRPEMERERVFQRYALDWIRANPGRYAELCLIRLVKTLWIDWDNPKSNNAVYLISRSVLVALSAVGLIVALTRRWSLSFPVLMFGSCVGVYTVTVTAARFSIPFEPFQLCLATLALAYFLAPRKLTESN